jgi:hypothetical protein
MIKIKLLAASVLAAALLFGTQSAQAHCDSVDGPVAKAALAALDTGNVNLALPYAPTTAETEIKAVFTQSLKVRALGAEAKTLADRAHAQETQKGVKEPKTITDVAAARERVSAELGFVTYVEGLHQAVQGASGHEHKE